VHAKSSGGMVIYLSLFFAMSLNISPWPNQISNLMPNWTLLVLMYWNIALPHKVSVGTGFATGLLFDTLTGAALGQNALIFSIASFLSHTLYSRLRNYLIWQQAILILFFLLTMQLLALWISQFSYPSDASFQYWLPAVSSAIIWPIMFASLRLVRRRFKVQ